MTTAPTNSPVGGVLGVESIAQPPELSRSDRLKSLFAINLTALLAGIAMGSVMPMVSMAMEVRGEDTVAIGYVVAAAPLALLLCGPFIGTFVARFGLLGAILGGTVITATTLALMPHFYGPVEWFVLRFICGIGIAIIWILGETWINAMATTANRGRVIAVYMMLLSGGFAVGPMMTQWFGVESWIPFYLAGGLIALSAIPLFVARKVAPVLPDAPPNAFASSFRMAPLVMCVALLAGIVDSAQISFLPVYGVWMGIEADLALTMLVVLVIGSCVSQIPVGWLADQMDRRILLVICMAICCGFGAALPFVLNDPVWVWPVLAGWGGSAFALYSLSLVLLGDRFSASRLAGANAAFVSMFEVGSVSGPVAVGYAMDYAGPNGMVMVLVGACVPVFILAYVRRVQRRRGVVELGKAEKGAHPHDS